MATGYAEVSSVRNSFSYIGGSDFVDSVTEEPLWTASISTGDSNTNNLWDDEDDKIKHQIDELIKVFHSSRYLQLKQLPRDITEKELQAVFTDYTVQSIQVGPGSGKVYLQNHKEFETFEKGRTWTVRGHKISVFPSPSDNILCVASLPADFSEDAFVQLVQRHGPVRKCFLMRSDRTGESKGYGFVEYDGRDVCALARSQLDGMRVSSSQLVCEPLDPGRVTFHSLHSTCLKVEGLPRDYRDMAEFRQIFSVVTNPPYCQIALKQGRPQDFGLVEYSSWEDAQRTLEELQGYLIKGSPIRISYCIPGVRAINIYMKLMTDNGEKGQTALLPEPPTNTVMKQLQNLMKHNPQFAQNLQNIVIEQIQNLQSGSTQNKKYNYKNSGRFEHRNEFSHSDSSNLNSLLGGQPQSPNFGNNIQMMSLLQQMMAVNNAHSATSGGNSGVGRSSDWGINNNYVMKSSGQQHDSSTSSNILTALLGHAASASSSQAIQNGRQSMHPYQSVSPQHGSPPYYQSGNLGDTGNQQELQDTINTLLNNAQNLKHLLGNLNSLLGPSGNSPSPPLFGGSGQNSLVNALLQGVPNGSNRSTVCGIDSHYPSVNQDSDLASQLTQNYFEQLASLLGLQNQSSSRVPDQGPPTFSNWSPALRHSSRSPNSYITPSKRKHTHILPSPEPSPETGYIGQHSQGIGGHYADSYSKRKKKH